MNNETIDVVVMGGGPAGSAMASFLAMQGHSLTVLKREKFPREHVGESIPFCYHVFKELGVLETMIERWVGKPGVRFVATTCEVSHGQAFHPGLLKHEPRREIERI